VRRARNLASLVLVTVLGFGSFAAVTASKAQAAPTADCAALAQHAHGPAVQTIQQALKVPADGDFGPKTASALKTWQTKHKLKPTGVVDAATWKALPIPVAVTACGQQTRGAGVALTCTTLHRGSLGPAVTVLQKALGVEQAGIFGPKTQTAVLAMQGKRKLPRTGVVDAATWAAIGLTGTPACVAAVEAARVTREAGNGDPSPAPSPADPSAAPSPSASPSPSSSSTPGPSASPTPTPTPKPKPPADAAAQAKVAAQVTKLAANLPNVAGTTTNPVAQKVFAFAKAQTGKPYKWGGVGPKAYDCSGLVLASYLHAGITIPRVAADQYGSGTAVPLDQAQQGDLLFYASDLVKPATIYHVVMYAGAGTIVDAPYTGAYVGTRPLWTSHLLPVAWRPFGPLTLPVKLGATGWTVSQLQQALVRDGFKLTIDGGFGPSTQAAVKSWQASHKIAATGVVDVATWLSL
jgi:peptidoglycan hydrolase-like protein with peptidoglycan-binding domain